MTILFKLFGIAGLLGSLAIVYFFETAGGLTGPLRIFHWPAMCLTGVGPFMLVIVVCDTSAIFRGIGLVLGSGARAKQRRYEKEAMMLMKLSRSFYTDGPQVFETVKSKGLSEFLARMVDRLQIRMPFPDIRDLLETERDRRQVRLVQALNVFQQGVKLTPSVGMLGTILGMVQLLSTLDDPSHLGSHMSLALLTTFFGLFFSLAVWTPLHAKVERILDAEMDGYNMAVRWLELLEDRKPANYFGDSMDLPKQKKQAQEKVA